MVPKFTYTWEFLERLRKKWTDKRRGIMPKHSELEKQSQREIERDVKQHFLDPHDIDTLKSTLESIVFCDNKNHTNKRKNEKFLSISTTKSLEQDSMENGHLVNKSKPLFRKNSSGNFYNSIYNDENNHWRRKPNYSPNQFNGNNRFVHYNDNKYNTKNKNDRNYYNVNNQKLYRKPYVKNHDKITCDQKSYKEPEEQRKQTNVSFEPPDMLKESSVSLIDQSATEFCTALKKKFSIDSSDRRNVAPTLNPIAALSVEDSDVDSPDHQQSTFDNCNRDNYERNVDGVKAVCQNQFDEITSVPRMEGNPLARLVTIADTPRISTIRNLTETKFEKSLSFQNESMTTNHTSLSNENDDLSFIQCVKMMTYVLNGTTDKNACDQAERISEILKQCCHVSWYIDIVRLLANKIVTIACAQSIYAHPFATLMCQLNNLLPEEILKEMKHATDVSLRAILGILLENKQKANEENKEEKGIVLKKNNKLDNNIFFGNVHINDLCRSKSEQRFFQLPLMMKRNFGNMARFLSLLFENNILSWDDWIIALVPFYCSVIDCSITNKKWSDKEDNAVEFVVELFCSIFKNYSSVETMQLFKELKTSSSTCSYMNTCSRMRIEDACDLVG